MSGSNAFSPARDLTALQPKPGPGMNCDRLWLCGHKHRAGKMRGKLTLRCAACVAKEKAV